MIYQNFEDWFSLYLCLLYLSTLISYFLTFLKEMSPKQNGSQWEYLHRELLHQHFDKVRPGMNFLNRFDKILFENTVLV